MKPMKHFRPLSATLAAAAALLLSGPVSPAFAQKAPAQNEQDHSAHHPGEAPPPKAAKPAAPPPPPPAATPSRMDEHMKAMREMHEKMARARTPEERNALMAEHTKLMQEGMDMMAGMSMMGRGAGPGMGGMAPQGGMPARPGAASAADPALRQQMLEKRMDMMQSMMQMMMDRMQMQQPMPPQPPTAPAR